MKLLGKSCYFSKEFNQSSENWSWNIFFEDPLERYMDEASKASKDNTMPGHLTLKRPMIYKTNPMKVPLKHSEKQQRNLACSENYSETTNSSHVDGMRKK